MWKHQFSTPYLYNMICTKYIVYTKCDNQDIDNKGEKNISREKKSKVTKII